MGLDQRQHHFWSGLRWRNFQLGFGCQRGRLGHGIISRLGWVQIETIEVIVVLKKGLVLLFGDLVGILQVLLQILDADIAYSTFVGLGS